MAKFPSVKWFDSVRRVFNSDESYRGGGGGQCHCSTGIEVGSKQRFLLTFAGFECTDAVEVGADGFAHADFYLTMPKSDWRAMLEDIRTNDGATLHFTLNTLDLDRSDGLATSVHGDQMREDLFFRYNQTLQYFFDASARVKTEF